LEVIIRTADRPQVRARRRRDEARFTLAGLRPGSERAGVSEVARAGECPGRVAGRELMEAFGDLAQVERVVRGPAGEELAGAQRGWPARRVGSRPVRVGAERTQATHRLVALAGEVVEDGGKRNAALRPPPFVHGALRVDG